MFVIVLITTLLVCGWCRADDGLNDNYESRNVRISPDVSSGYIRFPSERSERDRRFESDSFVHHHHHHQHAHRGYQDNGQDREEIEADNTTITEIPLDFIENMERFSDVKDLLENLVEGLDEEEGVVLQNRFLGGEGDERDGAVRPKPAQCIPELKPVELATSNDPTVMFLPACTRIERCGGCCRHPKLECRPTQTETVNYLVYKTQYTGDQKLKYVSKEVILVDKHLKCKCGCKLQPEDCLAYQTYNADTCTCTCTNRDEETKCLRNKDVKLWNPDLCTCQCREEKQCSSDYYFDSFRCRCAQVPMRKRFVPRVERSGFNPFVPFPVVPLN